MKPISYHLRFDWRRSLTNDSGYQILRIDLLHGLDIGLRLFAGLIRFGVIVSQNPEMSRSVLGLAAFAEVGVHGQIVADGILPAVVLRFEVRIFLPGNKCFMFTPFQSCYCSFGKLLHTAQKSNHFHLFFEKKILNTNKYDH